MHLTFHSAVNLHSYKNANLISSTDNVALPEHSMWAADLNTGSSTVLVGGQDFFSNPRLSPDGQRLAWVSWNHPNMPWDDTALFVGDVASDGSVSNHRQVICTTLQLVS